MPDASPTPTIPDVNHRSPHPLQLFFVCVFRLLLLGVGGGLALLAGMVIAYFYPAPSQSQPPLLEQLSRLTGTVWNAVRQMPDRSPAPISPAASPMVPSPNGSASLEAIAPPPLTTTTQADQLTVTLPSDALFNADQSNLRPTAGSILDSITGDLQQFPGATVQVAAHTNLAQGESTAAKNRILSFTQAQQVAEYLSNRVGDEYHWIVVGYGDTHPTVPDDSPPHRQRNRRIEIVIDPQ